MQFRSILILSLFLFGVLIKADENLFFTDKHKKAIEIGVGSLEVFQPFFNVSEGSEILSSFFTNSKVDKYIEKIWGKFEDWEHNVSLVCEQSMLRMTRGEPGAASRFKSFDFSGKIPPDGISRGNLFSFGMFDYCIEMPKLNYYINTLTFGINNTFKSKSTLTAIPLPVMWGLCLPEECSLIDVHNILFSVFSLISVPINETAHGEIVNVKTLHAVEETPLNESPGAIFMIIVCSIFVFLSVLGTFLDWLLSKYVNTSLEYRHRKVLDYKENGDDDDDENYEPNEEDEKKPLLVPTNLDSENFEKDARLKEKLKMIREIAQIFSLFHNYKILTSPASKEHSKLRCLNGMRVISILWVMLGHAFVYEMSTQNTDFQREVAYISTYKFQIVSNAFFSVDTFFFLSGFLAMYLMLGKINLEKFTVAEFFKIYWHRYWRITPVYLFLMLFWWNLTPYFFTGPMREAPILANKDCNKMWINILYLANFNFFDDPAFAQCLGHGWYLNNDFQFFVITPFIVLITLYKKYVGLGIVVCLLFASWVYTIVIEFQEEYPAFFLQALLAQRPSELKGAAVYFTDVYIKPWTRFGPYGVGLCFGWAMFYFPNLKFFKRICSSLHSTLGFKRQISLRVLQKVTLYVVLVLTFLWMLFLIYVSGEEYHIKPSFTENLLYITFARTTWGLGLGVFVFSCAYYGGWINTFLGAEFFTLPSRIGLSVYLIHPMLMSIVYNNEKYPLHFNIITRSLFYSGFVTCSYASAMLLTLFVEAPLVNLQKYIFAKLFKI